MSNLKKKMVPTDIDEQKEKVNAQTKVLATFASELDNMISLDNKKRILWKEIYKNAVDDRECASLLFNEAYLAMNKTSTDHIAVGATLVKYLEKMSKSNQQLIELSALITNEEEQTKNFDPNDIFDEIEKNRGK